VCVFAYAYGLCACMHMFYGSLQCVQCTVQVDAFVVCLVTLCILLD